MKKNTILIVMIIVSLALLGTMMVLVLRPGMENQKSDDATSSYTTNAKETTGETTVPATTQPQISYVPDIYPNKVSLYIPAEDGTKDRVKVTEFTGPWTAKKDIDCFEAFASLDDRITGTRFVDMWKEVWNSHITGQNGKIGYILSFTLADGKTVDQMIRKPSDADSFRDYIEIYLYDDINQTPGVRYTHLSDGEITEDTILSSIKLTCGSKIDEVKDIKLTAFIYTGEDCFAADGSYIGNVMASVVIREE